MAKTKKSTKSCTVQPLAGDQPVADTSPEKLGEQARVIHDRIATSEQSLTRDYWELGQTLELAKKDLNHGQWNQFLTDYGIDKTRAARARAIRRTFSSPDKVEDLTLKQAYEARRRKAKKTKSHGASSRKPRVEIDHQPVAQMTLHSFLTIDESLHHRLLDEIQFASESEVPGLLAEVEHLEGFLEQLRSALLKRLPVHDEATSG